MVRCVSGGVDAVALAAGEWVWHGLHTPEGWGRQLCQGRLFSALIKDEMEKKKRDLSG